MMCPLLIDCLEHVGFRNLLQGGGLAHSSGNAARLVFKAGGSLRDVQQLAATARSTKRRLISTAAPGRSAA